MRYNKQQRNTMRVKAMSVTAMPSNKELISVYLDSEIKEKLQKKADREERSMSFIAAKIIEKALKEEQSND